MLALAELKALLGMDNSKYKASMRESEAATTSFQRTVANAGKAIAASFTIGAVVSFGRSLLDWADRISQAAQNVGVLSSEMLAYNNIALQNNLSTEDVGRAISKLKNNLDEAIRVAGPARKSFENMGVSMQKISGMGVSDQLREVMRAAIATNQPLEALSSVIGEKIGQRFVSFARDLNAVTGKLGAANGAIGESIDQLERMSDELVKLKEQSMGFGANIAAGFTLAGSRTRDFIQGAWADWKRKVKDAGAAAKSGKDWGAMAAPFSPLGLIRPGIRGAFAGKDAEDARLSSAGAKTATATQQALVEQRRRFGGTVLESMHPSREDYQRQIEENHENSQKLLKAIGPSREDYDRQIQMNNRLAERLADAKGDTARKIADLSRTVKGEGIHADSLAQVGGFVGTQRAGMSQLDKQVRIAEETKILIQEGNRIQGEILRATGTEGASTSGAEG